MAVQETVKANKGTSIGVLIAAAVAVSAPMTVHFEGTVLHPYHDMGGYQSVCNGERFVAMHDYTKAQCLEMLQTEQAKQYAPEVYACTPSIATNPFFFGTAIDAAWNAGSGGYCSSPMARLFKDDPMSEFNTCEKGLVS